MEPFYEDSRPLPPAPARYVAVRENLKLLEENARLRAALTDLHEHVHAAAPLSWASGVPGAAEDAYQWERALDPIRDRVQTALGVDAWRAR